jgi:hypothetical protein
MPQIKSISDEKISGASIRNDQRRPACRRSGRRRDWTLFFEESLKGHFCILGLVYVSLWRTPWDKVIAEIGPLFIHDPLCRDFPAFVVGMGVIELALSATAKVPTAMKTGILPIHSIHYFIFFSAKGAIHDPFPSIYMT